MALSLGQARILRAGILIIGVLSFSLGIIAEHKKPPNGVATTQGDLISCVYPANPYVPLGASSAILLAITSVLGVVSIFVWYNDKVVPVGALARSKMLVAFGIISSILFSVTEGLLLWAIITEKFHETHHIHNTAHCPTAKTGLMGGAAFLALDTTLFWLVCQMLSMNARADYLEVNEDDEKGSYGYTPDYNADVLHPASKA